MNWTSRRRDGRCACGADGSRAHPAFAEVVLLRSRPLNLWRPIGYEMLEDS